MVVCSVLTIAATPLTLAFYPARHRPANKALAPAPGAAALAAFERDKAGPHLMVRRRFTVVLDQLESFGAVMLFTHLLGTAAPGPSSRASSETTNEKVDAAHSARDGHAAGPTPDALAVPASAPSSTSPSPDLSRSTSVVRPATAALTSSAADPPTTLIPLRLVELTERGSDVMLASAEAASHLAHDALVALYRTFASLAASTARVERGEFAMTAADNWPATIARCASETEADLVLVPWRIGGRGDEKPEMGNVVEAFSTFLSLLLRACARD